MSLTLPKLYLDNSILTIGQANSFQPDLAILGLSAIIDYHCGGMGSRANGNGIRTYLGSSLPVPCPPRRF